MLVILSGAKRSRRIRLSNKKDGFFDFVGKYCIFSYFAQNDTERRTATLNYNLPSLRTIVAAEFPCYFSENRVQ